MISLAEINAIANKFKVPTETIEKDYAISWILTCLSKSNLKNNVIFYGGTAIKRIYFEEHRFSEDIDLLSSKDISLEELLQECSLLNYAREEANFVLEVNRNEIISAKGRKQLLIHYSGYDEISGAPKVIRMDFSMGADLYGKVAPRGIINTYSDLSAQNDTLFVMSLNTILANKLGMLTDLTRNEPRDLFDLWFLLQRTDQFYFNFNQICGIFKHKYGFHPSLSVLMPHLHNPCLKAHWDLRLKRQVAELPDINSVISAVEARLRELLSPTR